MQHSPEGYSAIEQSLTRAATCREIRNLLLITGGYPGHLRATLVGALKDVIFEPSVLARFIREGAEDGLWGDEITPNMMAST
jgi:hypothetical protein